METNLEDLRESNEFLNLLLDNINTAVLIADDKLQIYQVNNYFLHIFDGAAKDVVAKRFGKVTGCVHSVKENKPCGETTACSECLFRKSMVRTLLEKVPADKVCLKRTFFIDNRPEEKYLEFSTRHIIFQGRQMILVIIYDVSDIEKQKIELQRKQAQINQDLAAAAMIQKSLLPETPPASERIQMAWKFEPSGKIGGDIFNIHYSEKGRTGVYMLDVCGHGVSAALITVAVNQFLISRRTFFEETFGAPEPKTVLEHLNQAFPFERFDSFFTMIYISIDENTGELVYSCAGHPPPVIVGKDNRLEILKQRGPAVGAVSDHVFTQEKRTLEPGDKVVLYTDGILEGTNAQGEFFGKKRFYEAIRENGAKPLHEMVDSVYFAARNFSPPGTEPDDDISLLVVELH